VSIANIRMQNVRTPIFIRLGNRGWGQPTPTPGRLRGIKISGVHATGAILTSSITGIPEQPVEDVALSDIRIETDEGGERSWTDARVPEEVASYPEARMFGRLPAYGIYIRHARDVRLSDVVIRSAVPDPRPLLVTDDVVQLSLRSLTGTGPGPGTPLLDLRDTRDGSLHGSTAPHDTDIYLRVSGGRSAGISMVGNDLTRAGTSLDVTAGVPPDAVRCGGNLQ
jgi:hypothetical protein